MSEGGDGNVVDGVYCDPFLENLPKRADNFFLIYLKFSVTAYLSYGASFDATLALVFTI